MRNRWKVDQAYLPLQYESGNPLVSNGVFPFSEPVLVSYMDLDILIEAAPLTKFEHKVLVYTMRGYSLEDIGERHGCAPSTVLSKLKSAVLKIVAENNSRWENAAKKSGVINIGREKFV